MGSRKYYAVRKGRVPGIYRDWSSCQQNTAGFPNAEFKSFKTEAEAQAYLRGMPATGGSSRPQQTGTSAPAGRATAPSAAGEKWYAIAAGHSCGVFCKPWNQIQPLVTGFPGAMYQSFSTETEARQWYAANTRSRPAAGGAAGAGAGGGALSGTKRHYSDISDIQPPPAFSEDVQQAAAAAGATGGGQQQQRELMVTVFFDGGSRQNPGRAGYGYVIYDRATNERLRMGCKPMAWGSTNNEAEYSGMIAGLKFAHEVLKARHVVVKGDSELAVKQMKGVYRVNSPKLLPLFREAKQLQDGFASFEIQHVYREENSVADALSNIAMDSDAVVDQIAADRAGGSRQQIALALARACGVESVPEDWSVLCTAECFLEAAAGFLSRVWDNTSVEEILADLNRRGWTEGTGGPPVAPPAAGRAPQAAGGRGQQTVAVAAVTLGQDWSAEVRRQEQLMQQQRSQQQQRNEDGARREQDVQQQRQRQRQRQSGPGGSGGGGAAGFDAQTVAANTASSSSRSYSLGQQQVCWPLRSAHLNSISSSSSQMLFTRPWSSLSSCAVAMEPGRSCQRVDAAAQPPRQLQLQGGTPVGTRGLLSRSISCTSDRQLQRGFNLPDISTRAESSTGGSRARSRLLQPQPLRCSCCSAESSRPSCALHPAVWSRSRAASSSRLRGVAGVAAMAAAGRLWQELRAQHTGRRAQCLRIM